MRDYWIQPVFIVFGIVIIVMFTLLVPSGNWMGLDWSAIRSELIYFLPFLVALGVGLSVLYILRRS